MSNLSIAAKLARRELRGGLKGFRVFLACLVLGVAAISGVGSISSAILSGLNSDAQAILGGDVALRVIHVDLKQDEKAWLANQGEMSRSVQMRAMATGPDARRALVEFKAVDGLYPLYGALDTGPQMPMDTLFERRAGVWGAAVEEALLARFDAKVGDTLKIGGATYEIRAVIENEPDRLSGGRAITLGPRLMVGADSVAETGLIQPGSLVTYFYRLKLPPGTDLKAWRETLDTAWPQAQWLVRDSSNASPQVSRFVSRTTLFMTLVGLTTLLVGGVGVGNAIRNYLSEKTETIATLKCIGAGSGLIFRTYLLQTGAMALLGIGLGLIVGALIPVLLKPIVAAQFPIASSIAVYPAPLLLAAAFGLLTSLVFSLWPLAQACETRPAALFRGWVGALRARPKPVYIVATAVFAVLLAGVAIVSASDPWLALWFVGGTIAAFVLFRLAGAGVIAAAKRAPATRSTAIRLALSNLHRPGAPTASVVLSLGLGLTVLVTVALIEGNMRAQITESMPQNAPGFFMVDIQPDQAKPFDDTVNAVPGVRAIERMPMLRGRITAVNGVPAEKATIQKGSRWLIRGDRGVTWSRLPPEGTELVAGDWWPEDYNGKTLVSLSADAAFGLGLAIGDTITVNVLGRNITAEVASTRNIRWQSLRMNFVLIFSPGIIENAPQTQLATIRLDPASEPAVERAVTQNFLNISVIRVRDVLKSVGQFLERVAMAITGTATITIFAGVLVLAGAVVAGHRRRVYDAVVLKVIGARRRDVLKAYLVEYGLLGVATAIVAGILGSVAAWAVVTHVMRLEWLFLPDVVVATAAISAVITLLFGFAGTWRALGQKAAPLLRNE